MKRTDDHRRATTRGRLPVRWFAIPFLAVLALAFPAWGGTCSGTVRYTDRLYSASLDRFFGTSPRPARYVDVFLYTADFSTLLGEGETDGNGDFSFSTTSMGVTDVRLVVAADSDNSPWVDRLAVYDNSGFPVVQSVASAVQSKDTDAEFTFDYTIPDISGSSRTGDPFNILDVLLASAEQVFLQTGVSPPQCTVYWYDGRTGGTYYSPGQDAIYLLGGTGGVPDDGDNDGYDDPVIIHEYGHFLADQYSKDDTTGGQHSIYDYYVPTLTWSEGWANFWPLAVRNNMLYWDATDGDYGFHFDFEAGISSFPQYDHLLFGMNNEAAVAMVLYDIFDSADSADTTPGVDDDDLAYGLDNIWTVFDTWMDNPALLVTLLDMYGGWAEFFPSEDADPAYVGREIEFVGDEDDSAFMRYPLNLVIPDGSSSGVSDELLIQGFDGAISEVRVFVCIRHPSKGQLRVRIRHPDSTEVAVHSLSGGTADNLIEWYGYPTYAAPAEPLSTLAGKSFNGVWSIKVSDESPGSQGELKSWGIRFENAQPTPQTGVNSPFWQLY